MRGEAILIFSFSAVSTAIRGLGGGSAAEAWGGSAQRGHTGGARELPHSQQSLSAGRRFLRIARSTSALCCTHGIYWHRNGLDCATRLRKKQLFRFIYFFPHKMFPLLQVFHIRKNQGPLVSNSFSEIYECTYSKINGGVSASSNFTRQEEVLMVTVRIFRNLDLCGLFFAMYDWCVSLDKCRESL